MADSPGSSLSSLSSDDFPEDVKAEDQDSNLDIMQDHPDRHIMPPTKRQRVGPFSHRSTPISHMEPQQDLTDISSDTSGDVPDSPRTGPMQVQDDEPGHEQITVCRWEGCPAGDLRNMDALVQHIHDDHIGTRQKMYSCQWDDCARKGMNHASGYALRAHMRSHTREKPFYCALPECDRSFTRSDALAKHMRTVHETEALRPSDPVPRNHSAAQAKPQRLKLIMNRKPPAGERSNGDTGDVDDDATIYTNTDADGEAQSCHPFEYPPDVQFSEEEIAMPPSELFRLLRRQVYWSEEEHQELRDEVEALEARRKEEWQAKELVLANVMEAELAKARELDENGNYEAVMKLKDDLPHPMLPMSGATPWYRIPVVPQDYKEEVP
ncbi:MAG: hypothetical protein FRX48_05422 [Lasallia pustulata]|uniref:C2H2-type domain-containing protein n=1 Tax=Lasallia pustulata TaxID=136370 RepID=A0A5M8PQB3_9LECA|nr:MAG: hypothetical protein FRX48_05422 [Lasallia pustulata]